MCKMSPCHHPIGEDWRFLRSQGAAWGARLHPPEDKFSAPEDVPVDWVLMMWTSMGVGKKILLYLCDADVVLCDFSFMFHVHNGFLCCVMLLQDTEHFSKKPLLIFMPLTIKAKARNWLKNLRSHSKPPFIYSWGQVHNYRSSEWQLFRKMVNRMRPLG